MSVKTVTLIYGVVFLLMGLAGFVPGFREPYGAGDPELLITAGAGHLFGLFPVNVLHNLTHVLFGIAGLLAFKSVSGSYSYLKAVAIVYALFVIMGFIPGLQTTFGLVPLHGNDIWLHVLLAAVAAYFGFMHKEHVVADDIGRR